MFERDDDDVNLPPERVALPGGLAGLLRVVLLVLRVVERRLQLPADLGTRHQVLRAQVAKILLQDHISMLVLLLPHGGPHVLLRLGIS